MFGKEKVLMNCKRMISFLFVAAILLSFLLPCAAVLFASSGFTPEASASLSDLFSKLSGKPSVPKAVEGKTMADVTLLTPNEAPGIAVESNEVAVVDYSNICDGYIMVMYTAQTNNKIKCQIYGPAETYPYTLIPGEWAALPLSEGDGEYRVSVLENIGGTKYAQVLSCTFHAVLTNEFGPFLRSNLYVNYEKAPNAIATAEMLTELMVIFAVLCLAVFSVLTLSTVLADSRLEAAANESVVAWYRADAAAEEILAELRANGEDGIHDYSVPVSDTQRLDVSVRLDGEEYEVLRWQLVYSELWQLNDSLEVWSGE